MALVATTKAMTFTDAMARVPMRAFQWATVAICLLVLVSDGIDLQLLGIVAPLVIADFGVDRGTFGVAMSAALVGFGLGAWSGGWLGDAIGRRYTLALAALLFSLATIGASQAGGVWSMALWRIIGGLGFGAAYANSLTMAGEWVPERLRPVTVSTLSVGTPIGGTIVGWYAPAIADAWTWRGPFIAFGAATLALVLIVLAVLRDSPSFLLAKGRKEEARDAAGTILKGDVELVAERHDSDTADGEIVGVFHRSNLRFIFGIGIAFTASALCAYANLNWGTTYLKAAGFSLEQAGHVVAVGGLAAIIGSIAAGVLARQFGSRAVMIGIGASLMLLMVVLGSAIERLPAAPNADERMLVMILFGAAAAVFSAGIAMMYVIMIAGYPPSCRSAGIGFGILMGRVGAISASGFGGALLDLGHGSVVPFFAVLALSALLISAAAFVIERHVPPARRAEFAAAQ